MRESRHGFIRHVNGYLFVQPEGDAADVAAIYRDLAVFCVQKQVRCVLVKLADDDRIGERSLRTALTAMVLAGLPAEFRLALLAETDRVAAWYRGTERDLCAAGIDAKLFESEQAAADWLNGSST